MLGSGWFGVPGDEQAVQDARFTPESTAFFDRVDGAGLLSVRDYLSQRVLNRAGYHNVILTGCPAWYHLPSLGKPLRIPSCLQRVVFTPPRKPLYASQSRQLMEGLRRWLPDATLHCSFHRGIGVDSFTSPEEADTNHRLHVLAQELGFEVHDVAYDLDRIAFYADCDLHVGYRVHAHLDFLSRRRPSVLLAEDSRGRGACEALGLRAFPAWERQPFAEYLNHIPGRVGHALRRRYGPLRADAHLADQVLAYLRQEVESGFRRFVGIPTLLDRAYEEAMRPFVARIPE
jgi:polysaccharide pyruvyl transferase WcaK-like protein